MAASTVTNSNGIYTDLNLPDSNVYSTLELTQRNRSGLRNTVTNSNSIYTDLTLPDSNVYSRMELTRHNSSGPRNTGKSTQSSHLFRRAAVGLGLLSAILLAATIFLCVIYTRERDLEEINACNGTWDNLEDQLQRNYDSLNKEKQQLQTDYDQLQRNYNSLEIRFGQLNFRGRITLQGAPDTRGHGATPGLIKQAL
ncbi:hypothetical protein SKAU_G00423880 [Synaphobranchus kaupii]|uniref:Uncharacterized protein n=1 Tax=Synaphobranchus kaupii TaxID=118154 RepID=A0A9Q1E5I1_SYNKA|nr:hypothetical protein SKAU_G00423880 [Synaphobranchus kaupii]